MTKLKNFMMAYWPVLAGLLVGGFFLGGAAATKGLFSGEMAAWVQGVGTVGAIAAAVWMGSEQWRRDRLRRQDEWTDSVNDMIDIVQFARLSSAEIRSAIEDRRNDEIIGGLRAWNETSAAEVLDRLLLMPIENWPTPLAFVRVRRYRLAIESMLSLANMPAGQGLGASVMKHPRLREFAAEVTRTEDEALATLGQLQFRGR